ncbi:MAG: AAA family ATPase [Bacteroidia bacterium]|nr:AAA family ATPase [Bacteroidia bacterium]
MSDHYYAGGSSVSNSSNPDLDDRIKDKVQKIKDLEREVGKVVVGQQKMINRLLVGLFTNGHILLEGVPGLAKTLTISSLARALHLEFKRIQFTPDLLPADLVGTLIYNQKESSFEVKKGPIFANIVLADEINRSPAKVQSALLEAMQEKQVTIGETTYSLDKPFLVLATQNPVEQEGTYPLPEAQVDRFMMRVFVEYPSRDEEKEIMRRMARTGDGNEIRTVMTKDEIFQIRKLVDQVRLSEKLEDYIIDIVMASRNPQKFNVPDMANYIEFGASPRASIALNLGAKCHAFMEGRSFVLPEDIKAIAKDVLNHRIILNYEAEAEEISTNDCVDAILRTLVIN